jgi:hypothetical protein
MIVSPTLGSVVGRSSGGGLADVVELSLDKDLVIDAFVRISLGVSVSGDGTTSRRSPEARGRGGGAAMIILRG